MNLLLDESVPRRLAASFPSQFAVHTVQEMGWAGTINGTLPSLAAQDNFDAFITVDRGIAHQQNLDELPIPVVVMLGSRNRLAELQPLVPGIVKALTGELRNGMYQVSE